MSDIFDHALDAFESLQWEEAGGPTRGESGEYYNGSNFDYDPLYYHSKVKIESIEFQTEQAYLFKNKKGKFWVPKSLCRGLKKKSVFILSKFQINYLEEDFYES